MSMLLEVEKQPPIQVVDFSKIERVLKRLRSYGPSSFAILTNSEGEYLQIAGGAVTCVIEYGMPAENKQYRAHLKRAKVPFDGPQTLMFGGGQMEMQPDEILFIDDVIPLYRSFFEAKSWPEGIMWRDMSSVVHGN